MYILSQQLKSDGFNINTLQQIIERNNENRSFNTLQYYCIYIVFKHAVICVEGTDYEVEGPNLIFIGPSKEIIYKQNDEEANTFVIAFSASFYEKSANDSLFLNSSLFFNLTENITITPTIVTEYDIKKFAIDRLALYKSHERGLYISITHNTVETLILDGLLNISNSSLKSTAENFSSIDYVNRFRIQLHSDFKSHRSVKYFSEKLFITSRRLSEMTEKVTGKTPKQLIIEKVLSESLRLIKHSTKSITEISYEMEFRDEANFSSFVKKHSGKTPREHRASADMFKKNSEEVLY